MTKVVVRVLDADGRMLGWTVLQAAIRGDGNVSAERPVAVLVREAGVAASVSVHWADVNTEVRVPLPAATPCAPGAVLTVFPAGPLMRVGPQAGGLPPIPTDSNVSIGVPTAGTALVGR